MTALAGLRVMIVEDEPIVAMCLEEMLEDLGCRVVASATNVAEGLRAASDAAPEAAILDINLGSGDSYPVAEALAERGVPIVFATGYGRAEPPGALRAELIGKPYSRGDIAGALARALG